VVKVTASKRSLRQLQREVSGRKMTALHYPTRRQWSILGGLTAWGSCIGWPTNNADVKQMTQLDPDEVSWIQEDTE
jgi:hypothetical protein